MKRKYLSIIIINLLIANTAFISKLDVVDGTEEFANINQLIFDITQLGEWSHNFGLVGDIDYYDGLLFLTGGDKELFIINIDDPLMPENIGSYDAYTNAKEAILVEDLLFVALEQNGIDIINVENKSKPEQKIYFETPGIITDFEINDEYMYIAKEEQGIQIVDVSNLIEPIIIATVLDEETVKKIGFLDSLLFAIKEENGLDVYNISNIENPIKIGSYTDGDTYEEIITLNNNVFLVNESNYLKVCDINNIADVQIINEFLLDDLDYILPMNNDSLCITQKDKITLMNCSDTSNISEITNYNTTSKIQSLEFNNDTIFLGCKDGIEIIQQNSTQNFKLINRFGYEDVQKILFSGKYLFIAMGMEGLTIIDATNPTKMRPVSTYQTNGSIVDICKNGDVIFALIENIGIEYIDIQDIENPIKIGEYIPSGEIRCFYTKDEYLFVGNYVGGELEIGEMLIVDISNLNEPQMLGNFWGHFAAFTKVVYNGTILCLLRKSGIHFIDLQRFIADEHYSYLDMIGGNGFSDLAIKNNVVYTCYNGDLRKYDIDVNRTLNEISWRVEGVHYSLYLANDSLYTRGISTINIFAIPEKSTILKLDYEINNSILRDLVVEDSYIAIANIGLGDDILLFNRTITVIEDTKTPIWPYIVGTIGGVIVIAATVFGVIAIRKKRAPEIQLDT